MKKYLSILLGILMVFGAGFVFLGEDAFAYTFPSTNEQNKTGTNPVRTGVGPHVNVLNTDIGEITLEFVMPYTYSACFEYRVDGETSQYGDIYPHPVIIGDYWYYYKCINNETWQKTFYGEDYVEVRLAVGAERDWDFDWTKFDFGKIPFVRSAEILTPATGETAFGSTIFSALLNDENPSTRIQWAVRKGICSAATNTVLGNVDGRNDPFTWIYNPEINQYSFSATADVCTWEPDKSYCFVFNPGGGIRLTRTFEVPNCDADNDGVRDDMDLCKETTPDSFSSLGINRYLWSSGEKFDTLVPAKKNTFNLEPSALSIQATHGCSCEQILDELSSKTSESFSGHYKFGCSKSVVEDWISNKYYLESLTIPANSPSPTYSQKILYTGSTYFLKAYGVADAGDTIDFDAKYSKTNRITEDTWTDEVSGYKTYGSQLLDLYVNDINVDWGVYNDAHIYWYEITGNNEPLSAYINDIYYPNNIGNLYIDIFVKLY
jgi:hypothetical protein